MRNEEKRKRERKGNKKEKKKLQKKNIYIYKIFYNYFGRSITSNRIFLLRSLYCVRSLLSFHRTTAYSDLHVPSMRNSRSGETKKEIENCCLRLSVVSHPPEILSLSLALFMFPPYFLEQL